MTKIIKTSPGFLRLTPKQKEDYNRATEKTLTLLKKVKNIDDLDRIDFSNVGPEHPEFIIAYQWFDNLRRTNQDIFEKIFKKNFPRVDEWYNFEYVLYEIDITKTELPAQIQNEMNRIKIIVENHKKLNLNEANKYFFGTEDTDKVKQLFESELETDSDVMFTFEDTEESRMNEFLIKLKNATKQSLFAAKYRLCVLYSYLHSAKTRQVFDLHSNSTPEIKASLKKHHRIPEYTEILFYCIDKCLPENFAQFDSINLAFAVDINADEEYYHKPGREIQKSLTIIRNDLKKSFSKFFDVKDLYFDVDRNCYTVIVSVDYHI